MTDELGVALTHSVLGTCFVTGTLTTRVHPTFEVGASPAERVPDTHGGRNESVVAQTTDMSLAEIQESSDFGSGKKAIIF
jgi:hypothetical protein